MYIYNNKLNNKQNVLLDARSANIFGVIYSYKVIAHPDYILHVLLIF